MNLLLKIFMGMVVMAINGSTSLFATLPGGIDWTGGAAYSLHKIVSGYSGSAIRLVRASDGLEKDFGFTTYGTFDSDAWLAWVSGTTTKVAKWYDQSGNSNTAEQSDDAVRPRFELSRDGRPAVIIGDVDFSPQLRLTLPSGIQQNIQGWTQFSVGRCVDQFQSAIFAPVWPALCPGTTFNDFGPTDGLALWTSIATSQGLYLRSNGTYPARYQGLLPPTSRMETVGIYSHGTGIASDESYSSTTCRGSKTVTEALQCWKNAGVPQMPTGGALGCAGNINLQGQGEMLALIVARGGSNLQSDAILATLNQSFNLRSGCDRTLWWVGDSLSAFYELGFDYRGKAPGVLCDAMQESHYVRVFARASQRWDTMDTNCAAAATGIDTWYSEFGAEADIFVLLGANDMNAAANGGTAATLAEVQARCLAFIANRRAAGAGRLIIGTNPPGGIYYTNDATRLAFNAWLMSGGSGADGIVDLAALDWDSGQRQADNIHWTELGNTQAAQAVADFLTVL